MATPSKPWPHRAEWARIDCIALAQQGRQYLLSIIEDVSSPAQLRKITRAIESFREIESKLNEVKHKENT